MRHPQGKVAKRNSVEGEKSICTSIVVASELRFGATKRASERLKIQLEAILLALEVMPLEEPADRRYGDLRTSLGKRGKAIGPNNMLIAAHALALNCAIITADVREFSRVPGLEVQNWL